jgi:hypothetical protein
MVGAFVGRAQMEASWRAMFDGIPDAAGRAILET